MKEVEELGFQCINIKFAFLMPEVTNLGAAFVYYFLISGEVLSLLSSSAQLFGSKCLCLCSALGSNP
jgi:hypothetical protein